MLDQNTDRMWYVIGAVLVGAAIILIANGTIPEIFASVTDSFTNVSKGSIQVVENISADMTYLDNSDLKEFRSEVLHYDIETDIWDVRILPQSEGVKPFMYSHGFEIESGSVIIPWNHKMVLSYEVYIPEGYTGFKVNDEINNDMTNPDAIRWNSNDFDDATSRIRLLNGSRYPTDDNPGYLNDGEWNSVSFTYVNNNPLNKTQSDLSDRTRIGVNNHTYAPVDIQMRNIKWYVIE